VASQPSLHSASDYEDSIHSLKHVSQQLKSLELWRQQEAIYKVKDQLERDGQIALLEEQIKALKKRDEKIQNKLKSRSNSSKGSRSGASIYGEEEGLRLGEYYQQPSHIRRQRKDPTPREVKVDLPHFQGKDDVEAYLDWEMKVEQLFACHQVSEERKVPLATLSFQGYAMYWWTSIVQERLRSNGCSIEYWNDLKSALRRRHIPSYYNTELMNKLQRLQQRNMSVEEYRQKMELLMMRAGIIEEESITISRFLSGLNLDIRDRVELLPYQDLNDLVQICIKVEQQN